MELIGNLDTNRAKGSVFVLLWACHSPRNIGQAKFQLWEMTYLAAPACKAGELHAASDCRGFPFKQGPPIWLCQSAGAGACRWQ